MTADDGVTLELKQEEGALPKFSSLAYTGKVVEKYGQRIVINVAGLKFKDVVPFIADHDPSQRIGHGKVSVGKGQVRFEGEVSSGSDTAKQFVSDSKNGFPFEASVGVKSQSTRYIPEKQKVNVNGAELVGPLIVIEKGLLREVSATTLGADDDTTSTALSASRGARNMGKKFLEFLEAEFSLDQETFETLSDDAKAKFENQYKLSQESDDETPAKDEREEFSDDEHEEEAAKDKGMSRDDFKRFSEVLSLTEGNYSLAYEAIDRGLSDDEIKDKLELAELRNNRGRMPDKKKSEDARTHELKLTMGRLMTGLNLTADEKQISFADGEVLIKYFKDEKTVDEILDRGSIGLQDFVLKSANMHPACNTRFDGDDIQSAMAFLQHQNSVALAGKPIVYNHTGAGRNVDVQLSFNSALMPNAFHNMCRIAMVERLRLSPQCTPGLFRTGQNANLLPTPRMRINAGEKWKKLTADGKLQQLGWGEEEFWQTWLCTRGGMLTFKEDDIINDNMMMIEQIIAATVEMGDTEDWEFFQEFFHSPDEPAGPNAFWTEKNSLSGPDAVLDASTKESMIASYMVMQNAIERMMKKEVQKGKDTFKINIGTRYNLLYGCNLEYDVWKLFKDESFCDDCEINSYRSWFRGKLNCVMCDNMDNEHLYGEDAGKKNWALITTNRQFSPFENTTLRGSRGSRVEAISLPADCLGTGIRFWKRSRLNRMDPCGILRARP